MSRFVIRRLLQAIPSLLIISILLFLLMRTASDPVATLGGRSNPRPAERERLTRLLGLDKPLYLQYVFWLVGNDWARFDVDGDGVPETPGQLKGVLRGDFGKSVVRRGQAAMQIIWERVPSTLLLMIVAEVVIIAFSLLIGVFSALHQYSLLDHIITALAFIGYSMPIFFIAIVSMYLFGVKFKQWGLPSLPTVGMYDLQVGPTVSQIGIHLVLPVASIAIISIAGYSRFVRATMLEVMSEDYVRTAKSKGLRRRTVVYVHALKNASLPLVTIIGLDIPLLLGGALVTEQIFGWPGTGFMFLFHTMRGDTAVVMGVLMLISVAVIVFQIFTDIAYAWLDPRIRYD
jgi:peptide/nickel transport system permease protein